MKIVIAGAGDIGFHLAKLLCNENKDIILIDTNQEVLDYAQTHLDVITLRGDSSSLEILQEAEVNKARIFLAVTTSEKNNLVSAILAKKMGAKQTIARVNNLEYLAYEQRNYFAELGVDSLISPSQLAAKEIERIVDNGLFNDIFEFEDGKVTMIGLHLEDDAPVANMSISELNPSLLPEGLRAIAIVRGQHTIIPRGHTVLKRNDHLYFLVQNQYIDTLYKWAGSRPKDIKNVMILGGRDVGYRTALLLEKKHNVIIVDEEKEICKQLVDKLDNSLVLHADPSNIDMLKEEGLPKMDAVIAVTANAETNILTCLLAEEEGVYKTVALVGNANYTHISRNIGVDTIINKKLIAANNIFRFVRKGQIEAITSLQGVDAEVIEYNICKRNRLVKHPLKDLHFPAQALIGSVIRDGETVIPNGDFQLQMGDKVIVFTLSEAISKLEQLFR